MLRILEPKGSKRAVRNANDPMTRLLIKPIVFLLIAGLLGCTTTNFTTFEPPESPTPISHIRVTFISGVQFEAYDAIVTRESISGTTKSGRSLTVSMGEVWKTEVNSGRKISAGRTAAVVVGPLLLALVVALLRFELTAF